MSLRGAAASIDTARQLHCSFYCSQVTGTTTVAAAAAAAAGTLAPELASSAVAAAAAVPYLPGTMRLRILPGTKITFLISLPCNKE
jgi:hypothetical protein